MRRSEASVRFLAAAMPALAAGCASAPTGETRVNHAPKTYAVRRAEQPLILDARWDKPAWGRADPIELTYHMGERPAHFPKVQAKLLYDDEAVYVIFRVEDRYVRAAASAHQGPVCRDSCVEFFFTPGTDVDKGYFNVEVNCGGTMLVHFQVVPRKNPMPLKPAELDAISIAHTMPRIVDPEIARPTTWTVEYRFPTSLAATYYPGAKKPAPGVTWRANFYKCADDTSHPHWLTWSCVDRPKPDFHVPSSFGTLVFQ